MGQSIRCHKNINMWKIIIFSIIVTIVTSKDAAVKRKPKLFFVSTSSTTTTVSTRTLCYTTATTLTTCGRKKRAIGEIMDLEWQIPVVLDDNYFDLHHHKLHSHSNS